MEHATKGENMIKHDREKNQPIIHELFLFFFDRQIYELFLLLTRITNSMVLYLLP